MEFKLQDNELNYYAVVFNAAIIVFVCFWEDREDPIINTDDDTGIM